MAPIPGWAETPAWPPDTEHTPASSDATQAPSIQLMPWLATEEAAPQEQKSHFLFDEHTLELTPLAQGRGMHM